jgi:Phage tail assembly chaperone
MAKVVLGKRPKTIDRTLTAKLPDGSTGEVPVSYRYRTRKEFAELIDATFGAAAGADGDAAPDTVAAGTERSLEANADYIAQIVDGWGLDAPFTRESILQLCDELPGVALAIMAGYREAVVEGRLGN